MNIYTYIYDLPDSMNRFDADVLLKKQNWRNETMDRVDNWMITLIAKVAQSVRCHKILAGRYFLLWIYSTMTTCAIGGANYIPQFYHWWNL